MSKTIALNFTGPLQSWAGYAVVKTRVDTDRRPSERAIKGLLSAAFGIHRGETIPDAISKSSVQVINLSNGRVVKDYQTTSAQDPNVRPSARPQDPEFYEKIGRIIAEGKKSPDKLVLSQEVISRTYLADAQFLVLIEGESESATEEIFEKLLNPVWSPYLGRKAFAPTFPFILGMFDSNSAERESRDKLLEIRGKIESYVK